MSINQSRQQSAIAKVNDLGTERSLDARASFHYAVTTNQNLARGDDSPSLSVKKSRGMQYDNPR